ncbi:hypothetical protein CQ013_08060 [Arthrobacter sp. MYb216]|nr:hypothetical protein CQ013_08060 [Arthrobacter sp. MYb216]
MLAGPTASVSDTLLLGQWALSAGENANAHRLRFQELRAFPLNGISSASGFPAFLNHKRTLALCPGLPMVIARIQVWNAPLPRIITDIEAGSRQKSKTSQLPFLYNS